MDKTLQTMKTIIQPSHLLLTLEQISEQYKEGLNPSLLAISFQKTFGLITQISNKYKSFLTEQDIASHSLVSLDYALISYQQGKNTKFTTYFCNVLNNELRENAQYNSRQKRKAILFTENLEDYKEIFTSAKPNILDLSELKPKEERYCQLLLEGYTNKDISNILGESIMNLCNLRKKLKLKLKYLL
jgi:DNA-directed RNA polymerase specialized sigma subunit